MIKRTFSQSSERLSARGVYALRARSCGCSILARFEALHAYAHDRNAAHLPAWAEFNRRIGGDGSVGIWHETYTVNPGQYESIYANMPRFGLGRAFEHVPASGHMQSARSRIGRSGPEDTAPSAEQGSHDNAG